MPSALFERVPPPPLESLPRKRWTRSEIEELISMGWSAKRYELLGGELIDKGMGKNAPHILAVMRMHEWLIAIFGFRRVHKEDPIDVAPEDNERNEPEPDLIVLRASMQELGRKPRPGDILLAVEVSGSTLQMDLSQKAQLYARAGIPDYWILDLEGRRLIVHREPAGGKYTSIIVYAENESVAPEAAPQSEFPVSAAFGE